VTDALADCALMIANKSGWIMSAWISAVPTSLRQNCHGFTRAQFRPMPIIAELILATNRFNP
jgi:hypothetical protein